MKNLIYTYFVSPFKSKSYYQFIAQHEPEQESKGSSYSFAKIDVYKIVLFSSFVLFVLGGICCAPLFFTNLPLRSLAIPSVLLVIFIVKVYALVIAIFINAKLYLVNTIIYSLFALFKTNDDKNNAYWSAPLIYPMILHLLILIALYLGQVNITFYIIVGIPFVGWILYIYYQGFKSTLALDMPKTICFILICSLIYISWTTCLTLFLYRDNSLNGYIRPFLQTLAIIK